MFMIIKCTYSKTYLGGGDNNDYYYPVLLVNTNNYNCIFFPKQKLTDFCFTTWTKWFEKVNFLYGTNNNGLSVFRMLLFFLSSNLKNIYDKSVLE